MIYSITLTVLLFDMLPTGQHIIDRRIQLIH